MISTLGAGRFCRELTRSPRPKTLHCSEWNKYWTKTYFGTTLFFICYKHETKCSEHSQFQHQIILFSDERKEEHQLKFRRSYKKRYSRLHNQFQYISQRTCKRLRSNTGGVNFCWIGIQYVMPYGQKYTPPYCFFWSFAGWDAIHQFGLRKCQ